jgi:hypothetical protein
MGELVPTNRRALAVYPLFLFYTSIGWLILIAARSSTPVPTVQAAPSG